MGQIGVPTPDSVIDKIVRLRDEEKLGWRIIGQRFSMKSETAQRLYEKRKAEQEPLNTG